MTLQKFDVEAMASLRLSADIGEALYQLLSRLEAKWLPPAPPNDVFHAYDPLPLSIFLDGLPVIEEHASGRRFLDVGCGLGTKLAFMHYMGWKVFGIDRWPAYIEVAKEFVPEATLTCIDAGSVDKFDADVVYSYRPVVRDVEEWALENHIAGGMKPGALLWLPCRNAQTPVSGCEKITTDIWVRVPAWR